MFLWFDLAVHLVMILLQTSDLLLWYTNDVIQVWEYATLRRLLQFKTLVYSTGL